MGNARFVLGYLIFTVVVIVSQAFIPQTTDTLSLVSRAFIYFALGYALVVWLYRRGTEQALTITLIGGIGLALGVEGLKLILPQLGFPQVAATAGTSAAPNLLFVALAVPGLLLGTFLGRYIFRRTL